MKKSTNRIQQVKKYIDENITEDLSLTFISEEFDINKYYLCHLFKVNIGCSMLQYIKKKRLFLVRSYYEAGMSLLDAAMKAGYKNYSSFYKSCSSELGRAPSKSIDSIGINKE